jgi:hypothetical protein
VDRLLSNEGIDIDAALGHRVPYVVGPRTSIKVAMDWTDIDADGQTTIMLSLLTRHGRATPLVWLTVETATLNPSLTLFPPYPVTNSRKRPEFRQ